jgi:hypothetical protein
MAKCTHVRRNHWMLSTISARLPHSFDTLSYFCFDFMVLTLFHDFQIVRELTSLAEK